MNNEDTHCVCGYELPILITIGTKPYPSGQDVKIFGIVLQCPKCFEIYMQEFRVTGEISKPLTEDELCQIKTQTKLS